MNNFYDHQLNQDQNAYDDYCDENDLKPKHKFKAFNKVKVNPRSISQQEREEMFNSRKTPTSLSLPGFLGFDYENVSLLPH